MSSFLLLGAGTEAAAGGGGGGGSVSIAWKGAATKNTGTYDTSFSFSSIPLSTTGYNVVAVGANTINTGEWSTCTIDGVSATKVHTVTSPANQRMAIFVAASSGHSTGTVAFTTVSFGADAVVMDCFGMTGAASATPSATADVAGLTATTSIAIPANGAAIGFQFGTANGVSPVWTGMTADDSRASDSVQYGNAAHTNTGGTTTVGCSVSGGTDAETMFAAWGP